MATKYGRGGFGKNASSQSSEAARPARRALDPKRRLLYIYIGILVFCVLMLVFHGLGLQHSLALLPPEEGMGVVAARTIVDGEFFVTVEVEVPESEASDAQVKTLADNVRVPQESHVLVEVGETLRVVYQLNQDRTALIVRELSLSPVAQEESTDTFDVEFESR